MGIRKQFGGIFNRNRRYTVNFERDSLQKQYKDFINATSKLEDKSIDLRKKYALRYFHDKRFETPLEYSSLLVPEKFRNVKKVRDCNALANIEALLTNFIKAFRMINDFDLTIRQQITKMENFELRLQTLMKATLDSIIDVQNNFSKEEIEQSTSKYVAMLQEKKETDFHGLTSEKYAERLMGFVIINQFCIFLSFCIKCLQDLQSLHPHES